MNRIETNFWNWIDNNLPNSLDEIRAFNFNIAETTESFVIEMVGSKHYDEQDSDWACEEIWTSRPGSFSISFSDIGNNWKQGLDIISGYFRDYLKRDSSELSVLEKAEAVTMGFVDGELVKLWPYN